MRSTKVSPCQNELCGIVLCCGERSGNRSCRMLAACIASHQFVCVPACRLHWRVSACRHSLHVSGAARRSTERDCLVPWSPAICSPRPWPSAQRCRVCAVQGVGGSLSEGGPRLGRRMAWLCEITPIGNTPPCPLLLLWLTIDRVACGQVCFGFGHFELVPEGRVESQYANPLCLEGSLRPHGDLVLAGRIASRYANHLRCLGGQLPSNGARSGARLDNAPATVSLRQTVAAGA